MLSSYILYQKFSWDAVILKIAILTSKKKYYIKVKL